MDTKKTTTGEKKRDISKRSWVFVLYPESEKPDWRDTLDSQHIAWCESPLHDKDKNSDGSDKKAHRHILLTFEGKKTYSTVAKLTASLGGTIPQACLSVKGTVRYMLHLDNPEKAQYSRDGLVGHGGFEPEDYLKVSASSRYELIREMIHFIDDHEITDFCQLLRYAADEQYDTWYKLLCDNSAFVISTYITSRRNFLLEQARKAAEAEADAEAEVYSCSGEHSEEVKSDVS